MNGILILDRDGVIIEPMPVGEYFNDRGKIPYIKGSLQALRDITDMGIAMVVITNQAGVSNGALTKDDVDNVHRMIKNDVRAHGGALWLFLTCGHAKDADCTCRKPRGGMVKEAARLMGVLPEHCMMIGDHLDDYGAAVDAGVGRYIHVQSGRMEEISVYTNDKPMVSTRKSLLDCVKDVAEWFGENTQEKT